MWQGGGAKASEELLAEGGQLDQLLPSDSFAKKRFQDVTPTQQEHEQETRSSDWWAIQVERISTSSSLTPESSKI